MTRFMHRAGRQTLLATFGLLLIAGNARADLSLIPTVSMLGNGLYHYDYTIDNDTPNTLALITLSVTPGDLTVRNLTAPDGFLAVPDTGLGLVSFVSDSKSFDPFSKMGGFALDSPYAPSGTTFEGLTDPDLMSLPGVTQGPVVPEPGTVTLLGAMTVTGLCAFRRRRARRS